jgi:hypothetical protein
MTSSRDSVSSRYVFSAQALFLVTVENHQPALLLARRARIAGQPSLTGSKRLPAPRLLLDQVFMPALLDAHADGPAALGVLPGRPGRRH